MSLAGHVYHAAAAIFRAGPPSSSIHLEAVGVTGGLATNPRLGCGSGLGDFDGGREG